MSMDDLDGLNGVAERSSVPPIQFDPAKYLPEVEALDLSEAQKIELLQTLFSIMQTFVDLGFDVGAVDVCGQVFQEFNNATNGVLDGVESSSSSATERNASDIGGVQGDG